MSETECIVYSILMAARDDSSRDNFNPHSRTLSIT
jgi:hypothetical protein